jgi:hypothetical protein
MRISTKWVVIGMVLRLPTAVALAGSILLPSSDGSALGRPLQLAAAEPTADGTPPPVEEPPVAAATQDTETVQDGTHSRAGASSEALAKASQNPVADMISVPIQNNMNFGFGPESKMQNIMNIQPVIPFSLNKDWNLITRTIMPIVWQPELAPGIGPESGLGDIQFSMFLSPNKAEGFIWGVGPVFQFPSATDDLLGNGKFSAGPTAVGLLIKGHWVLGALVQNVWSYAGDSDRKHVNQFLLQPFINYNFQHGWYVTSAPIVTIDWTADSDDMWTVPLGGGVGKILRIGKLPVNISTQAYYNVATPEYGADWQLRLQMQFLFPR